MSQGTPPLASCAAPRASCTSLGLRSEYPGLSGNKRVTEQRCRWHVCGKEGTHSLHLSQPRSPFSWCAAGFGGLH